MNIYYDDLSNTEITRVGELDQDNLSYEYNTLLVFQHKPTKRVFYVQDSGCSCPTPFEYFYFRGPNDNNLTEITLGDSFTSFEREVNSFPASLEDRTDLIIIVRRLLR